MGTVMQGIFPLFSFDILQSLPVLLIFLVFKFSPIDRPHFLFFSLQGLNLLRKASALREEAQKLEVEGLQKLSWQW